MLGWEIVSICDGISPALVASELYDVLLQDKSKVDSGNARYERSQSYAMYIAVFYYDECLLKERLLQLPSSWLHSSSDNRLNIIMAN